MIWVFVCFHFCEPGLCKFIGNFSLPLQSCISFSFFFFSFLIFDLDPFKFPVLLSVSYILLLIYLCFFFCLFVQILGKAEFLNPGGSVKDRVAVKIIEEVSYFYREKENLEFYAL